LYRFASARCPELSARLRAISPRGAARNASRNFARSGGRRGFEAGRLPAEEGTASRWAIDAVSIEISSQTTDVAADLAPGRLAVSAAPNPVRGRIVRLQLKLPAAGEALVEMLDLVGRRVSSRTLDSAAPGRHVVELPIDGRLAPGLYFARVTQRGEVGTTRVVLRK
jgi:hypothetical protein